jgi:DNA-binding GntR family transcriptional regulator
MLDMLWDRHDRYSVMMRRFAAANPMVLDDISMGHDDHVALVDAVVKGRAREAESWVRDEVTQQLAWLERHIEFLAEG